MDKTNHSPDISNWLKLINASGVGSGTFIKLVRRFGTVRETLKASMSALVSVNGIGQKTAEKIFSTRDNFNADSELALADKLGVSIINFKDSRYPLALKKINDPPPVLYVKGDLTRQDNLAVAIVGSRRCSLYGTEQASRFSHLLGSSGFTVVSGMARGIDTASHLGAIAAGGRTIAVQGCGLANIFPPENAKLFAKIPDFGACISELPLTYEPMAENFPARNRIIAGLAMGVIVIEASQRSGSLITARLAMDYNREVMAVPGKIDSPLNGGSHQLIKQGARLIDSVEDVMEALGYIGEGLKKHVADTADSAVKRVEASAVSVASISLSDNEQKVFDALSAEPIHIEDVIEGSRLPVGSINASLITLRLKGVIKQHHGNMFSKN